MMPCAEPWPFICVALLRPRERRKSAHCGWHRERREQPQPIMLHAGCKGFTDDIHRWDREIVVLDAMERQRSKEDQLKHIFGHFASNRSYITVDQLRQAARDRYCKALFAHLDIDLSTGLEAFVVEADETQKLSKREFMNACRRLQARSQPGMLVSVLREQKEMHQKVEALRQAKA
eukprot:TRINITY_DN11867_c0_g1_i2.p1 TRINITY_DN11867_c0_g1~~TRINITY_DN11867_c0_g1_i2.p1  ORF type:complete len:176 (-),score=24.85 TRINITY_DN11867_c0_g1_i2:122-649(-)